jgi:hypothetical protein
MSGGPVWDTSQSRLRRIDQTIAQADRNGLRARNGPEFCEDLSDVEFGRVRRDMQVGGDRAISKPTCD